jgi:hypothetical protein
MSGPPKSMKILFWPACLRRLPTPDLVRPTEINNNESSNSDEESRTDSFNKRVIIHHIVQINQPDEDVQQTIRTVDTKKTESVINIVPDAEFKEPENKENKCKDLERTKNNSNLPQATSQTDSNNEYNVEGVQSLAQVQPSNHLIKKDTLTPALSQHLF